MTLSSPTSTLTTDIVIIGAGPVGLFAIFEAGMLGLKCHVIDALDVIGGQCTALYPQKPIYDIPAYPKIMAADLIDQLMAQVAPFHPTYHLGQQVNQLQPENGRWLVGTDKGQLINTGAVIIAAGVGAFGPNRPPLEGIESYEGRSIFYAVQNRDQFKNKKVVIAGGGDSAVDWALDLVDIASQITVVHRRPKFRAAPDNVAKLESLAANQTIHLATPYQLAGLQGQGGYLQEVILEDLDGNKKTIEADILLPFFGLSMNLGPILEWGLDLNQHHIKVDTATMATSHKGIYAIGDIIDYPGKLKLILTGFSESAIAAHAIRHFLHPQEELHFEYSTTKGIPGA